MAAMSFDVVTVGSGPAGMAGAVAAADAGLDVAVVDEQPRAGGQIFRRPPGEFADSGLTAGSYPWAPGLIADFEQHPRITRFQPWSALGVLRDDLGGPLRIPIARQDEGRTLTADRLLLATGAYDLPVAFPGWTLPGVMTAGGVQGLLKSQRMRAAGPIVVAGSHPLMLIVAAQLVAAGAEVAEVAFARGLPGVREAVAARGAIPGHGRLLAEMAGAIGTLLRARVRISTRTAVSAAVGDGVLDAVDLVGVDRSWRSRGVVRRRPAATLVLGYGFSPSTELARQAGCEVVWDSPRGGWVVGHDEQMATSADRVWIAGEPTGVAGAEQSRAEGRLAGLAIGQQARPGAVSAEDQAAAQQDLLRARRFSEVVQRMFEPQREGMASWATTDTMVCRCELVTRGRVERTLADNPFIDTANAVKLECRTGMGPCQGRYCELTVGSLVAEARGGTIADGGCFNGRFPVKPAPLAALARLDDSPGE